MSYGGDSYGDAYGQPAQPWGGGDSLFDGYGSQPYAVPAAAPDPQEGYGAPVQYVGYEAQPAPQQVDERALAMARIGVNATAIAVDLLPTALDPESLLAAANFVSRIPGVARRIPGFGTVMQALMDSTPDVPAWVMAAANGQEVVTQFVPSSLLTRLPQIIKDVRALRAARRAARQQAAQPVSDAYSPSATIDSSTHYNEI